MTLSGQLQQSLKVKFMVAILIIRNNQNAVDSLFWNKYYNSSHQNNYNLIPRIIITEV
jgi:hypothetical protein